MTVAVVLVLGLLVLLVGVVLGMRAGYSPILDAVRRMNRAVLNPRQLKSAGRPGAYASVIRHRGRTSGRAYETPVVPVPMDDGFVIPLPYGLRADWAKNVLAGGSATIVHEGRTYQVDRPEILPMAEGSRYFPAGQQRTFHRFGVASCLHVRVNGEANEEVGGTAPER
jgi:hypothetical protein